MTPPPQTNSPTATTQARAVHAAFFVTGTDTGVGKTTVACALLTAATRRGIATQAFKPAESGCQRQDDGSLLAADAAALWHAGNHSQDRDSVCLYRFAQPVAPGVAAAAEGTAISVPSIAEHIARHRAELERRCPAHTSSLTLVEGAGGILVPLGPWATIADLAVALALPLVIVARPGLGTINHTLLTIEAARTRRLPVAAVIFNRVHAGAEDPELIAENMRQIERGSGVRVLGCLPYINQDKRPTPVARQNPAIPTASETEPDRVSDTILDALLQSIVTQKSP